MTLVHTTAEICPHDGAPASAVTSLPQGTRIGDYEVMRRLGEGGMGAVYEVRHSVLGRRSAMKLLHTELASNQTIIARFQREAKAVNIIKHRNIVDIHGYSDAGEGVAYFLMELLQGQALSDVLKKGVRIEPKRLVHIFSQIMRALAAAHKKQIIHRDLKPSNVFLVEREGTADFVKLLDFGIARDVASAEALTQEGSLMGTPQYMSPEQAQGHVVDERSDIFSLGVMMYRAAVGQLPFQGEGYAEIIHALVFSEPPPPRQAAPDADIPEALEAVILRAMQKDVAARYQSIDQMLADMRRVRSELGIADETSPTTTGFSATATSVVVPRKSRRRLLAMALGSAAMLVLAVLLVLGARPAASTETAGSRQAEAAAGQSGAESERPERPAVPGPEQAVLASLVESNKLAEAKQQAMSALEGILQTGAPDEREELVHAAKLVGTPAAMPLLYTALDGSPKLRVLAACALRDLGLPDAAPKVRAAYGRSGNDVRVALAACLAPLGDKEAIPTLEAALKDPQRNALVNKDAAVALAEIGHGEPAQAVLMELFDRDSSRGRDSWFAAARGLLLLGEPRAQAALNEELARPEAERAVAAAESLARAGDDNAVAYLKRVFGDPAFAERRRAALVLAELGHSEAMAFVEGGLRSEDPADRRYAAAIFSRLAAKDLPEDLKDDLKDDLKAHRPAIARMADHDTDRAVRMTALVALLAF